MNNKNDLSKELGFKALNDTPCGALDINIQSIKQKVGTKLDSAYTERKITVMKLRKKVSLVAIAAALTMGIAAFAASGIVSNWFSSSSSTPDYKSLPTQQQVVKDIGYEAVLIENFENGYTFKEGSIVKNNLADDNGNSIEKFKSLSLYYEKNDDTVIFTQDKFDSQIPLMGEAISSINDTDIYYYSYTNKFVPADYKLTEADKKAEENGELVFSYGASEVKISKIQSVTWRKDGLQYSLMQIDGALSAAELSDMAKEAASY